MKKVFVLIVTVLLSIISTKAQDSQFSVYDASPVLLNPALTGLDRDNPLRVVAQYRNQWRSLSSSFVTSGFAVDLPLKDKWGVGGYVSNNETSRLISELNVGVSGSYDVLKEQEKHHLNAGASIGFINKRLDPEELVFDSQFDDGVFNENIESGEVLLRDSRFVPEISFGLNYRYTDPEKIYHPYIGVSAFHLTRPNESFITDEDNRLPIRFSVNGGTLLFFKERRIIVEPKGIYTRQGNATNIIFGATGEYVIDDKFRASLGTTVRLRDAVIPQIGVSYLNFTYLISYDINVSGLSEFSGNRGALEFTLIYNGGSIKEIKRIIKGTEPRT